MKMLANALVQKKLGFRSNSKVQEEIFIVKQITGKAIEEEGKEKFAFDKINIEDI